MPSHITRFAGASAFGALATVALFYLMQGLIKSDKSPFDQAHSGHIVDFIRVEMDESIARKNRAPEKPPPPAPPPPKPPPVQHQFDAVSIGVEMTGALHAGIDLNVGGTSGYQSDGDYLPIVKVAPIYPQRAISRGIEGSVLLQFTVTSLGTVRDIVVLESNPRGVFDRASIEAASKFKYKPKVVDGEPISVSGVQHIVRFILPEDAGGVRARSRQRN